MLRIHPLPHPKQDKVGIRRITLVHYGSHCRQRGTHSLPFLQQLLNLSVQRLSQCRSRGRRRQRIDIVRGLDIVEELHDVGGADQETATNGRESNGLAEGLQDANVGVLRQEGNGGRLSGTKVHVSLVDDDELGGSDGLGDSSNVVEGKGFGGGVARAAEKDQFDFGLLLASVNDLLKNRRESLIR